MTGRVLIAAGSDSGGGAGIQADIKTVTALGGYAATAITALTAQDTHGVHGIHPVPVEFIARQMELVLADIGADAIKTGMLGDGPVIETVAAVIAERASKIPFVLDPVMVAKGGARLLDESASDILRERLLPLAAVVTPNIPEAEVLLGRPIETVADMEKAARDLVAMGPAAALVKGGHMPGRTVTDVLADGGDVTRYDSPRIDTTSTHGTGCTLASAIACGIAQGLVLERAVVRARAYVLRAIETAPGIGHGHGPLNHGHTMAPFEGD